MDVRMSAAEFDIGDIVKCKTGNSGHLYGQVLAINEISNEIELCQTISIDPSLFEFETHGTWQPVECVEEHVPVNCNFLDDPIDAQVIALCHAWKWFGLVPLDEDTLWKNGEVPHVSTSIATVYSAQSEIIKRCWGNELAHSVFANFCADDDDESETNEYDLNDPFIDTGDTEGFTVAMDGSQFVEDTHDAVRFMNYARGQGETERQVKVRAFLNNLHLRVAREE